jgi:DNA-binding NarL/FixJ family response regulator
MIAIFLVEDNRFVADAVDGLLKTYPDVELAAVARTGEEALTMLPALAADVALIDLALPGMNGIEVVAAIGRVRPDLPCIILSAHREETYITQALAAGARGYITKELPLAIVEGVERVLAGEIYLSEDLRK